MAKKPPEPTVPSWVSPPPGYWIRHRIGGDVWRDVPVLGWDGTGPFAYWNGNGIRPEVLARDVFHEHDSRVRPGEYLRTV